MGTNNTYYDNDEKIRLEGSVNTSANDDNGEDTAYATTTGSGDMLADGSEGPDYVNDGFNDFI